MSLECKTIESVAKTNIHCPTCQRYFSIILIKHICNPIVPCGRSAKTRPRYEERYLEGEISNLEDVVESTCEECENSRKKARKATCPECEYTGWYICDDSDLCPVCKAKKEQPPAEPVRRKPRARQDTAVSTLPVPKPQIDLYLSMDADNIYLEGVGECRSICIFSCTQESIIIDNCTVQDWSSGFYEDRNPPQFYIDMMQSLSEFLAKLQETYDFRWQIAPGSISKLWLLHLYAKYGPENKTPLKLEW